jgi:hypothetical protein
LSGRSDHSAAAQMAGLLLQLERALAHLSAAGHDESVGVEVVDDVSRHRCGEIVAQEQDKNSVRRGARLLGDRSAALWRTLQIWILGYRERGVFAERYFLATNVQADGRIVDLLRAGVSGDTVADAVAALRRAGLPTRSGANASRRTNVQSIADDVLSETDEILGQLLDRIDLVENYDVQAARPEIANGFGIDPSVDREQVLDGLRGWFHSVLQSAWDKRAPAIVTRRACLTQCRKIERSLVRSQLLPRPASDLNVEPSDVARTRGRPFVEHLGRIEADADEVLEAIEHFVRFNVEKDRLAREGEIPAREWTDRGNRLKQRWTQEKRRVGVEHASRPRVERGKLILAATTYNHHETLSGHACGELYMTAGHYHRLADDDLVWWDPDYQGGRDA